MTPKIILSLRLKFKLTQSEFASLLGVCPMTVSKWERGLLYPDSYRETFLRKFRHIDFDPLINISIMLKELGICDTLAFMFNGCVFDENDQEPEHINLGESEQSQYDDAE